MSIAIGDFIESVREKILKIMECDIAKQENVYESTVISKLWNV